MINGMMNRFRRCIACFLVVVMLLFHITPVVSANMAEDQSHSTDTVTNPAESIPEETVILELIAEEVTEATTEETTETTAEETTEATIETTAEETTEATIETTAVEAIEEATEITIKSTTVKTIAQNMGENLLEIQEEPFAESSEPEQTLSEILLGTSDLDRLYDVAFTQKQENPDALNALTEEERTRLVAHTVGLYAAIPVPNEQNEESRDKLLDLFAIEWSDLVNGGDYSGYYKLTADVTLQNPVDGYNFISVSNGKKLTIDLNGCVIRVPTGRRFAFVQTGGELILKDSRPNRIHYGSDTGDGWIYSDEDVTDTVVSGGIITGTGSTELWGGAVCVNPDAVLTMSGGTISHFTGHDGGAIHCAGTFNMSGGTITGNTATHNGGGVDNVGIFTMIGGVISNNLSKQNGGGVNSEDKFTLYSGEIFGNSSENRGGGVHASSDFEMIDGIITGNTSTYNGGGVFSTTNFKMSGGTISNNSSNKKLESGYANGGGGVCVSYGGTFTMTGGEICSNKTETIGHERGAWGGGVFSGGTFTMTGGTICDNESSSGGGVMVWQGSTFTMKNGEKTEEDGTKTVTVGTISHNRATGTGGTGNGGAVYVETGRFNFYAGILEENWARRYGGGININAGSEINTVDPDRVIENGACIIRENSADNGGGISQEKGECAFVLDNKDFLVTENIARGDGEVNAFSATSGHGGGIFVEMGKVTINAGTISGNKALAGGGIALHVERLAGDINLTMNGGEISGNTAQKTGGGIDIFADCKTTTEKNDVVVTLNGGSIQGNMSKGSGGAIDIHVSADNATANMYIGKNGETVPELTGNEAKTSGGAIHIGNGSITMYKGEVSGNTAEMNGGAIWVNGGNATIAGGSILNNKANTGSGGGLYVSAENDKDVSVKVFSGILQGNHAAASGGAVGVVGSDSSHITVQIGVDQKHFDESGNLQMGFSHQEGDPAETFFHKACPVICQNASGHSGGAFYISGGIQTNLDIFCLTDENNTAAGDLDVHNTNLSNFMMVKGGQVIISTAEHTDEYINQDLVENNKDGYGNATVNGSIHVEAGRMELMGNMDNPKIDGIRTIDLKSDADRYFDHRGSDTKVKISYHENFYGPDGTVDSTQTALDLRNGDKHTIYTGLYVHEGYELYGWSTDSEAVAGDNQYIWYEPGAEFTFYNTAQHPKPDGMTGQTDFDNWIHYGDLTVYAIWKINGYFIAFDPGVPDGETWSGSVETISCRYNQQYQLPANGFSRPGYIFKSWLLDGTEYQPADNVINLTSINAATVTFVAQWEPCEHPETVNGGANLIYSVNTQGDTMTKSCKLCGLSATAKIMAKDAVYDRKSHFATLELTNEAFWEHISSPDLSYTGTKIKSTESVVAPERCVNAGDYVASLQVNEQTITASFRVDKAPQPAPTSRPSYIQPAADSNVVTIHQLPEKEQRVCQVSGVPVEYYLRYYSDDVENIVFVDHNELAEDTVLTYELTEALKTYAVLAGYPETDNYYASPFITADTTFHFKGNIHLTIVAEEGIDFWLGDTSTEGNGILLYTKLWDGYYLVGEDFTFEKKLTGGSGYSLESLVITRYEVGEYSLSATASDENIYITITIGGVKKIAALSATAKEKQHFSDFTPTAEPVITADSAFTVLYQLNGFHEEDYHQPVLTFEPALPIGSTIILRDRTDGSYWYYKASGSTAKLPLTQFTQMGASTNYYYVETGDQKLQFIVDFSRIEGTNPLALQTSAEISCSLSFDKQDKSSKAAVVLPKSVSIGLSNVSCNLQASSGNNSLSQSLKINVPRLGENVTISGNASRYDHRDLALVLIPDESTPLPIDASIQVNLLGGKITYRPNRNNWFVIPLSDFCERDSIVYLRLSSDMLPYAEVSYKMTAQLWLSATDAESAPGNGTRLAENATVHFYSNKEKTGLKILEATDQRLFHLGEQITVTVTTVPETFSDSYPISVQLHQKFPDGTFGNTALQPQKNGNSYTFPLNGLVEGSYCIVSTLSNSDQYVLNEARYYFILHDS